MEKLFIWIFIWVFHNLGTSVSLWKFPSVITLNFRRMVWKFSKNYSKICYICTTTELNTIYLIRNLGLCKLYILGNIYLFLSQTQQKYYFPNQFQPFFISFEIKSAFFQIFKILSISIVFYSFSIPLWNLVKRLPFYPFRSLYWNLSFDHYIPINSKIGVKNEKRGSSRL